MKTAIAGYLAVTLLLMPHGAMAQLDRQPAVHRGLIGLPIMSSDGHQVGEITQVGIDAGEAMLVAEIERPLGIGSDPIAFTSEMFVDKGDHVELAITAEQIRARVERSKR